MPPSANNLIILTGWVHQPPKKTAARGIEDQKVEPREKSKIRTPENRTVAATRP